MNSDAKKALSAANKYTEETIIGQGAIKGDKGDPGPMGPQGPKGDKGDKGDPGSIENVSMSDLDDVQLTDPMQNDILMYEKSANKWVNKNMPTIPSKTSDLTNDAKFQTDTDVADAIADAVKTEVLEINASLTEPALLELLKTKEGIECSGFFYNSDASVYCEFEGLYIGKTIGTEIVHYGYCHIRGIHNSSYSVDYYIDDEDGSTWYKRTPNEYLDKSDSTTLDDSTKVATSKAVSTLNDRITDIELFKFPNAVIVGEPTINHGQISNFSATSYLKFPFLVDFQNKGFEILMGITTGTNVTSQENIFDSDFGLAFAIRDGKFVIAISGNGTSWNLGEGVGTYDVQPNTTYVLKLSWDKLTYRLDYSIDGGKTFINDISKVAAVQPYPKQIFIGVGENFATVVNHFTGIIDLNKASLKIANELVWQGMDDVGLATRLATNLANIDTDGVQAIKTIVDEDDKLFRDGDSGRYLDDLLVGTDLRVKGSLYLGEDESKKTLADILQIIVDNFAPTWKSDTTYNAKQMVYYENDGCLYRATTTTSSVPGESPSWRKVSIADYINLMVNYCVPKADVHNSLVSDPATTTWQVYNVYYINRELNALNKTCSNLVFNKQDRIVNSLELDYISGNRENLDIEMVNAGISWEDALYKVFLRDADDESEWSIVLDVYTTYYGATVKIDFDMSTALYNEANKTAEYGLTVYDSSQPRNDKRYNSMAIVSRDNNKAVTLYNRNVDYESIHILINCPVNEQTFMLIPEQQADGSYTYREMMNINMENMDAVAIRLS